MPPPETTSPIAPHYQQEDATLDPEPLESKVAYERPIDCLVFGQLVYNYPGTGVAIRTKGVIAAEINASTTFVASSIPVFATSGLALLNIGPQNHKFYFGAGAGIAKVEDELTVYHPMVLGYKSRFFFIDVGLDALRNDAAIPALRCGFTF